MIFKKTDSIIDKFMANYERTYDHYERVARECQNQCEVLLKSAGIRALITYRAKHPTQLQEKLHKRHAKTPYASADDIDRDIVDFAGVRVALYFPGDQEKVCNLINTNFEVEKVKDDFKPQPVPIYEKRFSGYDATHYHVRLREGTVDGTRYTKSRVEIQVASVLMHGWAEVEHDLIYKPGDVPLSEEEHAILDEINGLVIAGEIALGRLQKTITSRANQPDNPFVDHYELAMHLSRAIRTSFPGGVNAVIMGRMDLLFRFLQLTELDSPRRLDRYTVNLDPDTDNAPIVEQIVDRIMRERQEFEAKYEQAKEEIGARNPYSSTLERPSKSDEAMSYGNFMLKWSTLENFVELLGRTKGYDVPTIGPSQVAEKLREMNMADANTLDQINYLRALRNSVVHRQTRIDVTVLNDAARLLDRLMADFQKSATGMQEIIDQADVASSIDPLTGLTNRRAFGLRVMQELARDPQQTLSLIMMDIDNFKVINDAYGHIRGDEVLEAVAGALRANTRSMDVIARYGGDEIYALLPTTNKEQAITIAEQYRQTAESVTVTTDGLPPLAGVMISIGISTITPATTNWQKFFREADEALYLAKQDGKNRVFHYSDVL